MVAAAVGVAEMVTYAFTVPAVPPSLNGWIRTSIYSQAEVKANWEYMVWGLVNEKGNRCPRPLAHAEISARITFATKRKRDADNFGACLWKFTLDGLVKAGVIPDDTPEYVTTHAPEMAVGKREETEITISGRLE